MRKVSKGRQTLPPDYCVELGLGTPLYFWIGDHYKHPPCLHADVVSGPCEYSIAVTQEFSLSDRPYFAASLTKVPTRLGRSMPFDCFSCTPLKGFSTLPSHSCTNTLRRASIRKSVRDVSHPRPGKEFDEVSSGDATRIRHATKIVDRLQLTGSGTIGDLSFHDVTDIIIEPADRRRSLFSVVAAAHCAFLKDSIDVFAETFVGSSADSDAAP